MKALIGLLLVCGLASPIALAQGDDERDTNYGNWVNEESCPITKAKIDGLSSPELRERIQKAVGNDEKRIQSELQDEASLVMTEIYLCSRFQLPMEEAVVAFALAQIEQDHQQELSEFAAQIAYLTKMYMHSTAEDQGHYVEMIRFYERQRVQEAEQYKGIRDRIIGLRIPSTQSR